MATLRENFEAVLNQARVFRAVIELAEELQSVEHLETLIGEANARIKAKRVEEAEVAGLVEAAKAALNAENSKIKKAKAKTDAAQSGAAGIIERANQTAKEIIDTAKAEADEIRAVRAAAETEADEVARVKQAGLLELEKQIAAAETELARRQAKLDEIRTTIKAMAGD